MKLRDLFSESNFEILLWLVIVIAVLCYPKIVFSGETKVWLVGSQSRIELLLKNIPKEILFQNGNINGIYKEVSQNGKKGVKAYNRIPEKSGGSFVFIEMSDRLMKSEGSRGEICEGQKIAWDGFLKQFKSQMIKEITKVVNFIPCNCEPEYVPEPPFTLKTSQVDESGGIKEIVLTHKGDKEFAFFWIEDANGKKVLPVRDGCNFVDRRDTDENRLTYLDKEWFDERTCQVLYTKWWDRNWDGDRNYWSVDWVDGHRGQYVWTVPAIHGQEIEISWVVRHNPNKKKSPTKHLFTKELAPEVDKITWVGDSLKGEIFSEGKVFLEDRVIELETFSGDHVYQVVSREGEFHFKNIPSGEYFLRSLFARTDEIREITPVYEFQQKVNIE